MNLIKSKNKTFLSSFLRILMIKVLILNQIFNAKVENIHPNILVQVKMLKNQNKFPQKK